MTGEVRGLKAGTYWSDEGDCAIQVLKTDSGTHIIHADIDTELAYHWIIDEQGKVQKFEISSCMTFDETTEKESQDEPDKS